MTSGAKYALIGGGALLLIVMMKGSNPLAAFSAPPPPNPTAQTVSTIGSSVGGILSGLKGLFGSTAAPLSGGTAPNQNDTLTFNTAGDVSGGNGGNTGPEFGDLAGDYA